MGRERSRVVRCPNCHRVQSTNASIFFICCGKSYPIDQNLYYPNEEVVNDRENIGEVSDGVANRDDVQAGSINRDIHSQDRKKEIIFTGGTKMGKPDIGEEEDEYNCADCGASVIKGQKYCGNCRKELNWEGIP